MNIELDEVVVLDVADDALEMAAASGQRGASWGNTCMPGLENWC